MIELITLNCYCKEVDIEHCLVLSRCDFVWSKPLGSTITKSSCTEYVPFPKTFLPLIYIQLNKFVRDSFPTIEPHYSIFSFLISIIEQLANAPKCIVKREIVTCLQLTRWFFRWSFDNWLRFKKNLYGLIRFGSTVTSMSVPSARVSLESERRILLGMIHNMLVTVWLMLFLRFLFFHNCIPMRCSSKKSDFGIAA